VSIFIDGVLVSDPYYGTFRRVVDPNTDIVQIRVATGPQSPIDGGRQRRGDRGADPRRDRPATGDRAVHRRHVAEWRA